MGLVQAEVGLIHGAGFEIVDDIQSLSRSSLLNVEKAAELLADRTVEGVVCSGHGPVSGEDYKKTEALLMADYLIRLGFRHDQVKIEDVSTSAIGNWALSATILHEIGATSVIGVTGKVNVKRMSMIGEFIAERSEFELFGYTPSEDKWRVKDFMRELFVCELNRRFLADNVETPIDTLNDVYEEYKSEHGLATVKRFIHRDVASSN